MESLKKYCLAICSIDGIDTYIISPVHYDSLMANQELLENLTSSSWGKDRIMSFIQTAKTFDALYFAFGHHKDRARLSLEWEPVLCYKKEDAFFHVIYVDSWMCRECRYIFRAPIIMSKSEAEPDFYYGTENRFPDIPPFFPKYPCPKCGRLLQNHLIILR